MSLAQLLDDYPPVRIPAEVNGKLSGFRAWVTSDEFPEKWRVSFLNGAILFNMTEETETHNKVKVAIQYTLHGVSKKAQSGTVYGDGVQLSNKAANLSTCPEAIYISRETLRSGRVKRVRRKGRDEYIELEGTPDLVVEVVSRSSRRKDLIDLPVLYHRAGIPEYWLIDALGDEIDFKILRRGPRRYLSVEPQRGWLASSVLNRQFKLVRKRDEDGDWQYDLKVKQ
ncbi:MAG: Uma2 family endonuclease [Pirellulales bacterium]